MKETIHIHKEITIDKDVTCCGECPLYDTEPNMSATLSICKALPYKDWKNVLGDISWRDANKKISSQCPYRKEK